MGMNAHAYFAYGVILEGEYPWKKIEEAVGSATGDPNEYGVTRLSSGEWGKEAIVVAKSVASVSIFDGAKVIRPESLADFDHPHARMAIYRVLEKLGHKMVSPEWLLMVEYNC